MSRRFGSPNHDSIWFEDKTLSYPNGTLFDNLRNEIKAWREHVLASDAYPCFTPSATGFPESEDDIGSIIQISDVESESESTSSRDDDSNFNKRELETLWKLYRNVGETIEDMKIRLAVSSEENNFFKNIKEESSDSEDDRLKVKSEFRSFDDLLEIQINESKIEPFEIQDYPSDCDAYEVPRLKEITKNELVLGKKRKNRCTKVNVKKEEVSVRKTNEPIICDMYGVITVNYNETPPRVKTPDCFRASRLSDSSCDEEIEVIRKEDRNVSSVLKNRFSNNKNKRKFPVLTPNLSSDSDESEVRRKRIKAYDEQLDTLSSTSSSGTTMCTRSSCSCSTTTSSSSEIGN